MPCVLSRTFDKTGIGRTPRNGRVRGQYSILDVQKHLNLHSRQVLSSHITRSVTQHFSRVLTFSKDALLRPGSGGDVASEFGRNLGHGHTNDGISNFDIKYAPVVVYGFGLDALSHLSPVELSQACPSASTDGRQPRTPRLT